MARLVRLTTWDQAHRVRVYDPAIPRPDGRQGQMWADSPADAEGPDETFEVIPDRDATFGLRIHGVYVSMQPDGRIEVNRDELRSWERFAVVPGVSGGWALRSVEFGYMLCAELAGGQPVTTRAYDAAGPWETFYGWAAAPNPVGGLFGRIRRVGRRGIGDDRGAQNWVGVSRFYHGWAMIHDRDRVLRDQDRDVANGLDYQRVMFQVGENHPNDYWYGVCADHTDLRHRSSVRWLLEQARQRGIRVLATLIGKGNGMDRQSVRAQYVREMADILRDFPDVVMLRQVMNEPGIQGRVTLRELRDLEAILLGVDAEGPTSTGAHGDEDGGDAFANTASWGMVGTPHFDRDITKSEMQDRPWRQPWDWGLVGKPLCDDEPIGPGASVASEVRANVLRSHRAVALVSGCFATCFHPDQGIRGFGNAEDVPGYVETPRAKRFLPPGIANGEMQNANSNFPNRHWDLPSHYLRSGNGNTRGIVRAYGSQMGGRQYTIPFGPVSEFELVARRNLLVECFQQDVGDLLWTRHVSTGESVRLSAEHPDYLLVSSVL